MKMLRGEKRRSVRNDLTYGLVPCTEGLSNDDIFGF